MPDFQSLITVTLASLALSITPGPSMLYVLSYSIGQNRAAGYASAIGLALGGLMLAIATALGLAALFETIPFLEVALRYAGSAYLVWLGVSMIKDAHADVRVNIAQQPERHQPFRTIVSRGIWVEMLNPKTVLFFALFIPPFIDVETGGSATLQLLILGSIVPLTAIPSDLAVAWSGTKLAGAINKSQTMRKVLTWASGLTLVFIAFNLQFGFI